MGVEARQAGPYAAYMQHRYRCLDLKLPAYQPDKRTFISVHTVGGTHRASLVDLGV